MTAQTRGALLRLCECDLSADAAVVEQLPVDCGDLTGDMEDGSRLAGSLDVGGARHARSQLDPELCEPVLRADRALRGQ